MFEKIAEIIEIVVGDGFTGEDYDRGWHDAVKRIADELADCLRSESPFFDRPAFLKACGLGAGETWRAVPYSDRTEIANPFAVATIIDGKGDIVADVFSQEAASLIEMAPELKQKLSEYERPDYEAAAQYLAEHGKQVFTGSMIGGFWNARCLDACSLSKKQGDKAAYELLLEFGDQLASSLSTDQQCQWQGIKDQAAGLLEGSREDTQGI